MRERLKSKKGFTLAELLIVVAIIAILIAIMMPVFGKSRADAIQAKDAANIRSAYSEAVVEAMSADNPSYTGSGTSAKLKISISKSAIGIDKTTTPTVKTNDSGKTQIEIVTKGATRNLYIDVDEGIDLKIIN